MLEFEGLPQAIFQVPTVGEVDPWVAGVEKEAWGVYVYLPGPLYVNRLMVSGDGWMLGQGQVDHPGQLAWRHQSVTLIIDLQGQVQQIFHPLPGKGRGEGYRYVWHEVEPTSHRVVGPLLGLGDPSKQMGATCTLGSLLVAASGIHNICHSQDF